MTLVKSMLNYYGSKVYKSSFCDHSSWNVSHNVIILLSSLGTHDFRNVSISSHQAGEVIVTGSFTSDSTASGVVVIIGSNSNVYYHMSKRDREDTQETVISGIAGGNYSVSIFVVEDNGLPFETVATTPSALSVEKSNLI